MAYTDTPDGCYAYVLNPAARQAIKDSVEFLKNDCFNTESTGSKEWDHGIFSCFNNPPLCLAVCCCPVWGQCIFFRNLELMTGQTCEVALVNFLVTSAVCMGPCYYGLVRKNFRAKYGLQGSPCTDWAFGCCCGGCALCSDANQLMVSEGYKVPYLNLPSGGGSGANKVQPNGPVHVSPAK